MTDKKEIDFLTKQGYEIVDWVEKTKYDVSYLFVFVSDTRSKHDSKYPFIRIFAQVGKTKLVDLGYHDHYLVGCSVNIDSITKNIFRIIPWGTKFKLSEPLFVSTFEIGESGELR